jgi:hypothetical protein
MMGRIIIIYLDLWSRIRGGFLTMNWNESAIVYFKIQLTLDNPVTVNPDGNMKNEKCCSQLSTYFKRHLAIRKADESLVCSEKNTCQFPQTCIITFRNKYNF